MKVKPRNTILDVKEKIHCKEGISPDHQRLLFDDCILGVNKKFKTANEFHEIINNFFQLLDKLFL